MHPVLEAAILPFITELETMDLAELQLHPGGNARRWNTQQIAEHLILSCQQTTSALEGRLGKGRATRARATAAQRLLRLLTVSLGYMASGVPAPEAVIPAPAPARAGRELARMLEFEAERMDRTLRACRERFGIQPIASHRFFGPLRVDQWRRFHAIHVRHHARQVRAIRKATPMRIVARAVANAS